MGAYTTPMIIRRLLGDLSVAREIRIVQTHTFSQIGSV
jgi:hypothetical protein